MNEKCTTSQRLKQKMKELDLRQVDVLALSKPFCEKYNTKLNRNDLSQYLSGKIEPGQKKLMVLAETLNVNPTWLMGLDVEEKSITREESYNNAINYSNVTTLFNAIPSHLNEYLNLEFKHESFIKEEARFGLFHYLNIVELYDLLMKNEVVQNGKRLTYEDTKDIVKYISDNKEKIKHHLKEKEIKITNNFEIFKKSKYYNKYLKEKKIQDEIFQAIRKERLKNNNNTKSD